MAYLKGMASSRPPSPHGRVVEHRRAVALTGHFREAEGLSVAQIAGRLGRSPSTVKAYFYDPTSEKAQVVKARYVGVCHGCGAYTPRATARATPTLTAGLPPRRDQAQMRGGARV